MRIVPCCTIGNPDIYEFKKSKDSLIPCKKIIGQANKRRKPYHPQSIINISAMSFGSLGKNAITALNLGAQSANCYHNTGEGGISPYHKKGAELVWQIGTGYFGARDKEGNFSKDIFKDTINSNPYIRMIEIKLSQGAKPGKGGILPKTKITEEISGIRGVPMDKDCISPNRHTAFSNVDEMLNFVEPLLGKRNNKLFEEFKRILSAAGGQGTNTIPLMEDSWYSVPLSETIMQGLPLSSMI